MIVVVIAIAVGMILVERAWPANELPKVRAWWARIAVINLLQLAIVLLAGVTWDRWLARIGLFHLREHLPPVPQAVVAYVVSTFVYYWWHRVRHESKLFWLVCHQLHHSPRRTEIVTSFFKHPVEITLNSILSALIVYPLLGCDVSAGALYTLLTALAEFFYHWNVRTPHWLGFVVQRPESHRIHHQYRHHTQNFADLPVWDMLFGTFANPRQPPARCGFDDWREDRFEDLLVFRNLHEKRAQERPPLTFLPTCIGCSKRWSCAQSAAAGDGDAG